jgi:hypothetical protein
MHQRPRELLMAHSEVNEARLVLVLARKSRGAAHWDKDDYDVRLGDGSGPVVGRIMVHPQAPEAQPWFWTITSREQPPSVYNRGEKDKTWRTVRITDKNGSETDVRVSDNFEQLSPREQAQRVDEFVGLVRSPTDKFFTFTFWAMLIAPPVAAGILLFLIAWVLSGFRVW